MSELPTTPVKLQHRIDRADRVIKYGVAGIFLVMIATMIFMVYQLFVIQDGIRVSLEESKKAGAENHQLTRQYVKCIADNLLKPVTERTTRDFEACGITDTNQPTQKKNDKSADQSNSIVNPTPSAVPQASEKENLSKSTPTQTNGSGGSPDDEEEQETPPPPPVTEQPGLVETLTNGLNGIVDNIKKGL